MAMTDLMIYERAGALLERMKNSDTPLCYLMDRMTLLRDVPREAGSVLTYTDEGPRLFNVPAEVVQLPMPRTFKEAGADIPTSPVDEPRCLYLRVRKENMRIYHIDDLEFTDERFL